MKSLVLAAVAALCVVALPAFAADTTMTTTTTMMSDADCKAALDKCATMSNAADKASCEADAAGKGCVKPK